MKIVIATAAEQDVDGLVRVFTKGLVGSSVLVTTAQEVFEGDISAAGWGDKAQAYGVTVQDYEDEAIKWFVPFHDIEEVTYL